MAICEQSIQGNSPTSTYKMAGNAVSVPVISAIGQRLYEINHEFGIVKE